MHEFIRETQIKTPPCIISAHALMRKCYSVQLPEKCPEGECAAGCPCLCRGEAGCGRCVLLLSTAVRQKPWGTLVTGAMGPRPPNV